MIILSNGYAIEMSDGAILQITTSETRQLISNLIGSLTGNLIGNLIS